MSIAVTDASADGFRFWLSAEPLPFVQFLRDTFARRGFFGPRHSVDAVDKAKQDIEEALFSRDEITDFPLTLNTQFFKSSDVSAKVSVVGLTQIVFAMTLDALLFGRRFTLPTLLGIVLIVAPTAWLLLRKRH